MAVGKISSKGIIIHDAVLYINHVCFIKKGAIIHKLDMKSISLTLFVFY